MIQILDNYKEEKYVNTRTFFHLLFMKQELFEIFIRPIKDLFICFSNDKNGLSVLNEQFTKNEKYLKLIKLLVKIYSNDDFVFFPKETNIEMAQLRKNLPFKMNDIFKCYNNLEKIRDSKVGNETENAFEKINAFVYYCL